MKLSGEHSRTYLALLGAIVVLAAGLALALGDGAIGLSAAVVALYLLHLYSMRHMRRQWQTIRELERLVGELGGSPEDVGSVKEGESDVSGDGLGSPGAPSGDGKGRKDASGGKVNRRFALGTVAIIEGQMNPEQVSRTMARQREKPSLTFADHAVAQGYLTETQLEDLVLVQNEANFSSEQIENARRRIREYCRRVDPGAVTV